MSDEPTAPHYPALDCPQAAAEMRDRIRDALTGEAGVTIGHQGGGLGAADLWLTVDGVTYLVQVRQVG